MTPNATLVFHVLSVAGMVKPRPDTQQHPPGLGRKQAVRTSTQAGSFRDLGGDAPLTTMTEEKAGGSFPGPIRDSGKLAEDPGPELECEELDWDGYGATLENRLASVGNSCWLLTTAAFPSFSSDRNQEIHAALSPSSNR